MADSQALSRALRNLIDNAMKYSGESRWIMVRAQATGGGVSVRSEPGRGSSFTLTLPAIAKTDAQPATVTSYLDRGATS